MPTIQPAGDPSSIFDPSDPVRMQCGIFKRVQIVTQPLGGSAIAWELNNNFGAYGSFHFYVDFGRSGTHDEWETLNSTPIVDGCTYFDQRQHHWDHLADWYYRIRLITPGDRDEFNNPRVYISQPQQANGLWSRKDWLLAKEIARKEYLMQRKRTNITSVGYILKRRRWGRKCTDCAEFDTGEIQSYACATCFGTGFVGGFFKAVDFRLTMNAPWDRGFKRNDTVSMTNDVVRVGRAVAYPYIDSDDVYVKRDSGERFYVTKVSQLVEVGGIPIVVGIELALAPVTDIIYTVPMSGGSSSSSSSSSGSSSAVAEPQSGLQRDDDW